MRYPPSVVNKKIDSIHVEFRGDGTHLFWEYHDWDPSQPNIKPSLQKHEIILKDVYGPELSRAHMLRIRAFCATITEEEGDRAKLNQKQWEKALDVDKLPIPTHEFYVRAVEKCVKSIADEFAKKKNREVDGARNSLKYSVMRALEQFSPDEVETIIQEAIAESVMKQ